MNKNIKATLENSGHDTGNYLSLRINKGDLPNGGEVVVMVKDKQTGDLRPITWKNRKGSAALPRTAASTGR